MMTPVPEQEPYSLNFQNAGYSSTLFFINARANLLLYAIQFSLVILFVAQLYCMKKCCPRFKTPQNFLFWNGSIRLFITSYLQVLLLSLLNLKVIAVRKDDKDLEFDSVVISDWFSVVFFSHCILIPTGVSVYYYLNNHRINNKQFHEKVG